METMEQLRRERDAALAEVERVTELFFQLETIDANGELLPTKESAIAHIFRLEAKLAEAREKADALDWWEKHLNHEHGVDYDSGEVVMYRVCGNINDREWVEVAKADTLLAALKAAMESEAG
jgi:hypothetical protein